MIDSKWPSISGNYRCLEFRSDEVAAALPHVLKFQRRHRRQIAQAGREALRPTEPTSQQPASTAHRPAGAFVRAQTCKPAAMATALPKFTGCEGMSSRSESDNALRI